jgi:hypothetical protein
MTTQPTKEQLEEAKRLLRGGNPKPEDWVIIPKVMEEELKRDEEYEAYLDAKGMNSEYEQDEPKED